jgi:hypothetical protein
MKVYTEVNYIWKDDKLVQTDSKSFDYEGEVSLCHSKTKRVGSKYTGYKTFNIPHTHKSINDLKPKGGTVADTTNVIKEGLHSGTSAITEGIKKANKDNPNPNLNVQTPLQLYEKGRDLIHDAATVASEFIDRNTDTITNNLPDTSLPDLTGYIPTKKPTSQKDELLYGSRRGIQIQDEGQRASTGGLRRTIHELKTLSGKAKPKG